MKEIIRIQVGCALIVLSAIGILAETLYALLSNPMNGLALVLIGTAALFAIGVLMVDVGEE